MVQLRNDVTIDEYKYRRLEHVLHVFGTYDKEVQSNLLILLHMGSEKSVPKS